MHNHTNMNNNHVIHITYPSPVDCDFCLTAVWTPTDRPVVSKLFITSSSPLLGESLVSHAGQDPHIEPIIRLLESIDLMIMERSISIDLPVSRLKN